jgi:hypothetical protein
VHVDVPARLEFSLEGARPNPAGSEVWTSFTLPSDAPATIELVDVAGRRVRTLNVTGAGRHVENLAAGTALAPGIYVIRLTQGGVSRTARVSVVR